MRSSKALRNLIVLSSVGIAAALTACGDDAVSEGDTTADTEVFSPNDTTSATETTTPVDTTPAQPETSVPDTGPADTAPADTGPADTSPADTEPADTGPTDTGPADTEPTDTGPADTDEDTIDDTADTIDDTAEDTIDDAAGDTTDAVDDTTDTVEDTADTVEDTADTVEDTADTSEDTADTGDTVGGVNSCDSPLALVEEEGDLFGAGDLLDESVDDSVSIGSCPALGEDTYESDGVGTPDEAWTFTVAEDGSYLIEVLSDIDADVLYMLFEGPGCDDAACLGYVDNGDDGEIDAFTHELSASKTYTLVIDTWDPDWSGLYLVAVSKVCEPQCDIGACGGDDGCGGICGCGFGEVCDLGTCVDDTGDTCVSPYRMMADEDGVFSEIGDLSLDTVDDDYDFDSCPLLDGVADDGRGTPDEVFTFEITEEAVYIIGVFADFGVDPLFALYDGDLCEDETQCVGQVDNGLSGGIDAAAFELSPGTYTIVVDTWDPDAVGAYQVIVTELEITCAPDLFFTEYVEAGEGSTKILEIYNGTGDEVDLSGYQIWRANNGAAVADAGKFALEADGSSPVLADGETWVICNGASDASFLAECDQDAGATLLANFNGNDYIGLVKLDPTPTVIDAIGVEGEDPGAEGWAVGEDASTTDFVLWRSPDVTEGNPDWQDAVANEEWRALPATTLQEMTDNTDIGDHDTLWVCIEEP